MRTMQKAAIAAVVLGLFWPGCATWGPGDPTREDDGGDAGGDDNIGRPPTTNGSGNPSQGMGASGPASTGAGASGEGSGPTTTSSGVGGAPTTTSSGVGGTSSSSSASSTASSSSSTTSTSSSSSASTSSSSGSGGSGGGPTSVGCLVDGFCTLDDDCVCADCDTDPYCSDPTNCTNDNVCDPFHEGCVCADCAMTHPECLN